MTRPIADGIMVEAMRITRLKRAQITMRSRTRSIAQTRQAIIYVIHKRTAWSWLKIANFVGLNDHTTAIHAARTIEKRMLIDADLAEFVEHLLRAREIDPYSPDYVPEAERPKPDRAPKPVFTIPIKLPAQKPKPFLERVHYEGGRYMLLDEQGDCCVARNNLKNMVQGSQALAKAIIAARAGV